MEIVGIVLGIVLGILAVGLFIWLRKDKKINNDLHKEEINITHEGMNAVMDNFNNYQVETDRKIIELEKQLEIKTKQLERSQGKLRKELPSIIGKVVGQIEFAQDIIKR